MGKRVKRITTVCATVVCSVLMVGLLTIADVRIVGFQFTSSASAQKLYRLPDGRIVRLRPGQRVRRVRRRAPRRQPKPSGFGGFLNSIFGGNTNKPAPGVRYNPPASNQYLNRYVNPRFNQSYGISTAPQQQPVQKKYPGYRTMCVRLCDGYYFPISFSTSRSKFRRDEQICRSRCNGDVALFYMRPHATDASTMRDRRGRRYSKLKNAFLYRKKYKPQCQCRPQPWSETSKKRHAMYARMEASRKARKNGRSALISGANLKPASAIIAPESAVLENTINENSTPASDSQDTAVEAPSMTEPAKTVSTTAPTAVTKKLTKVRKREPRREPLRQRRKQKPARPEWTLNANDA